MTWTKLGQEFPEQADLAGLSDAAFRLYVCALVFCNRQGTDGDVPRRVLHRLTALDEPEVAAAELVEVGWWQTTETGWTLPRFLDDQPTAKKVRAEKDAAQKRQVRYRESKDDREQRHRSGDHTRCTPRYCDRAPGAEPVTRHQCTTNGVSDALPTPLTTLPRTDPTDRSVPTGERYGAGAVGGGGEDELGTAVHGGSAGAAPRDAAPRAQRANGNTLIDHALAEELRRAQMTLETGFYDVHQADEDRDGREASP